MKFKLLASSVLMAGALMGSGTASASVFWSGTYDAWAATGGVTDADGDMRLTAAIALTGDLLNHGDLIAVTLSEVEVNHVDLYTVSFDFHGFNGGDGYNGAGGNIEYSLTALASDEWIASAGLDSVTTGKVGETVTKDLYNTSSYTSPFLTLTSLNGAEDPTSGETHFGARQTVYVKDTLNNTNGSFITHVDNTFDVGVPEIDATSATSALTLLFAGLGLLSNRRRSPADLMA